MPGGKVQQAKYLVLWVPDEIMSVPSNLLKRKFYGEPQRLLKQETAQCDLLLVGGWRGRFLPVGGPIFSKFCCLHSVGVSLPADHCFRFAPPFAHKKRPTPSELVFLVSFPLRECGVFTGRGRRGRQAPRGSPWCPASAPDRPGIRKSRGHPQNCGRYTCCRDG